MDMLYYDLPVLPPEIDIPDLNHNFVEPVVKIPKSLPWFVAGTWAVSEEDFE